MKIDSHHHFWRYSTEEYGWISEEMAALRRDFMPADLEPVIKSAGIDGVVSVQARQTETETEDLLALGREHDFIRGVVGWAPLADRDVEAVLERWAVEEKLKAVRHVVQDEPDDLFILGEDFNRGVGLLERFGLLYDILIFEKHLPQTIAFVDRHPNQRFVLDHIGKPRIREGSIETWSGDLARLAERENVSCKISGMATEADWDGWSYEQMRPYFDAVLESFGPKRLMFGTDWPVCLVATEYARWVETVERWASRLAEDERQRIWGGTAVEVYGL